jgi:hypothetical protein
VFREWDRAAEEYTGDWCCRKISVLVNANSVGCEGLALGYVVFGLTICDNTDTTLARRMIREHEDYEEKVRKEAKAANA